MRNFIGIEISTFAQTNLEISISKNGKEGVVLQIIEYTVLFNKENNIPNWVDKR